MRSSAFEMLTVVLGFAVLGCGGPSRGQGGSPFGCRNGDEGYLVLAWTLQGSPPTIAACAPYDHLTLTLESDSCSMVEVEPIPCAMTIAGHRSPA